MKKFLSLALALVLVLSMSTVAFASDYDDYIDVNPVVPKTYEVNNGTAPAETFRFTFEGVSYKNGDGEVFTDATTIPEIEDVIISFDAISANTEKDVPVDIDANDYKLGVYTYKVTENAGNTAGVTYSDEEMFLVLTILRDEDSAQHYVAAMHYESNDGIKTSSGFTNKYDAGSLTVTKDIKGNMADMKKKFTFTIVFTAPSGKTVNSTITVQKPNGETESITFTEGKATYSINLGDDETVSFANIPKGVTYDVTEDKENYISDNGVFSDGSKIIAANDIDTVTFTNTLTNEVDTGINMDNMPYILLLAVAGIGLFVFIRKKYMMRKF